MKTLEFEARIDETGHIEVPEAFKDAFGKQACLIVLVTENDAPPQKERQPGSAKGILQVLSEDDSHLEDFKDYMP